MTQSELTTAPGEEPGAVETVAWRFWELLGQDRADDAVALLDDDGTYWVGACDARGERSMRDMKAFFVKTAAIVPMTFTKRGAMVSGDKVALEVESYAETPAGIYNNLYCFIMTVQHGKIVRVHEYLDTRHAAKVLIPQLKAAGGY